MKDGGLLSISELAKLSRISRTALIYYDRIGLVTPVMRGENNYRYYSHRQIASTNLVNTLQSLGMPLREIADLMRLRTPREMLGLMSRQEERIDGEIGRLGRSKKLIEALRKMVEHGVAAGEDAIEARVEEEEPIFLGPRVNYAGGKTASEAILEFYEYCERRDPDMDMHYPVCGFFSEANVRRLERRGPDRFYFWMPDAPDRKPEGLYATGYARGYYGQSGGLFLRIMRYMEENGLEICGPAWEMYPLNEISVAHCDDYLIKISISAKRA
ncbi:MAG: MerR family transcriptional regulator [Synergistaceae bacterium]|nr:MerR family transcriptional regulator [Synergistaceae bacterium]